MLKSILTYYLASTGACYVLNAVATSAIKNKINRTLEEKGYEPYIKAKASCSERIVNFIRSIPSITIPVIRYIIPLVLITQGDKIVAEAIRKGIEENVYVKKEDAMTYEERLEAIEKKKAELESLKESLSSHSTYNFDETDYPTDSYVGEKESKTL